MERAPPPFFNTGPSPLARLVFFVLLSLTLLVADTRLRYLDSVRQVAAVVIYPLQRIAAAPAALLQDARELFVSHAALRADNAHLTEQNLMLGALAQRVKAEEAENGNLRKLLGARERYQGRLILADVLYAARDPFSQRIIVDKGLQQEVRNGQPVIDASGVVGQVTRAYPMLAEVTLLTDKGHLTPVLNVRNGLRFVLAGTGVHGVLELQFVPLNADVQKGDQLVTSGIDGIYPAGLPVAEVSSVEPNPSAPFSKVGCRPLGGAGAHTRVFVVYGTEVLPPRPQEDAEAPARPKKGRRGG